MMYNKEQYRRIEISYTFLHGNNESLPKFPYVDSDGDVWIDEEKYITIDKISVGDQAYDHEIQIYETYTKLKRL